MPSPDLLVSIALTVLGTAAVMGWISDHRQVKALAVRLAKLEEARALAGNRLHWEAIEDERARLIQIVLRLQAVKADMRGWEQEIEVALAMMKGK